MKNTSILLIIVLVIIVVAGGIYYFVTQTGDEEVPAEINVNATSINATITDNLPDPSLTDENWDPATRGDLTVNAEGTHNDVTFSFSTASRVSSFQGVDAEEGNEFVVVYFGTIPFADRDAVVQWLGKDVAIVDGAGTSYALQSFQVITEYSQPSETGFFQFAVPTGGSNYRIQFGEGEDATTVGLGF
ncbi:MAG: hypothetical protein WCV86_04720 [Patescibacteria group bacterium]|jgi:hypothetical protein